MLLWFKDLLNQSNPDLITPKIQALLNGLERLYGTHTSNSQ